MQKLITGLLVFSTITAYAGIDKVASLQEVLSKQSCKVTVVKSAIDFEKQSNIGRTGHVYLGAFMKDLSKVRRLDVGRQLIVSKIESFKTELKLKDPSIAYLCVDYAEGETIDCDDISNLTISQIEELSDYNLKFNCSKDDVVLF